MYLWKNIWMVLIGRKKCLQFVQFFEDEISYELNAHLWWKERTFLAFIYSLYLNCWKDALLAFFLENAPNMHIHIQRKSMGVILCMLKQWQPIFLPCSSYVTMVHMNIIYFFSKFVSGILKHSMQIVKFLIYISEISGNIIM